MDFHFFDTLCIKFKLLKEKDEKKLQLKRWFLYFYIKCIVWNDVKLID